MVPTVSGWLQVPRIRDRLLIEQVWRSPKISLALPRPKMKAPDGTACGAQAPSKLTPAGPEEPAGPRRADLEELGR